MATFAPRLKRRTVFQFILITVCVLGVGIALLAVFVYFQAVNRFEVRRIALPTRVFADTFLLRSGAFVGSTGLEDRLGRLGYRKRKHLQQPGEFADGEDGGLAIYLRGF